MSADLQVSPVLSEPTSPLAREVANKGAARQPTGGDTFVVDNRRSQSGYSDDRQPLMVDGVPVSASLRGTAAVVSTVGQPPGDNTAVASEPTPVPNGDSARQPSSNPPADPPPPQSRRDRTERTTSRRVNGKGDPDSSSSGSPDTDRSRRTARRGQRRRKKRRGNDSDSSSDRDKSNESKRNDVSKSGRSGRDKDNPSDREDKDDKQGCSRRRASVMDAAVRAQTTRRRLHVAVIHRTTESIGSNRLRMQLDSIMKF